MVIYRSVNGVKWTWKKATVSANVDKLCNFLHSHDLDKAGTNNRKWAMLSCSFGGRVMVEYCQEVDLPMPNAETPLIVTGYPWYADAKTRPKDERVVVSLIFKWLLLYFYTVNTLFPMSSAVDSFALHLSYLITSPASYLTTILISDIPLLETVGQET